MWDGLIIVSLLEAVKYGSTIVTVILHQSNVLPLLRIIKDTLSDY